MSNPIVIGARPSSTLANYFGIRSALSDAKREGSDLDKDIRRVDDLMADARELLLDALFDIAYLKTAVQQGSLFK